MSERFVERAEDQRVIAEHFNSENERLTIQRVSEGAFAGQLVLCVHDDPPGETIAPMLLDRGTIGFLLKELGALSSRNSAEFSGNGEANGE